MYYDFKYTESCFYTRYCNYMRYEKLLTGEKLKCSWYFLQLGNSKRRGRHLGLPVQKIKKGGN